MTNIKSDWITLLKNLGTYLKNENALSNVTAALCRTNKYFQIKFLSFCFSDNPQFHNQIRLIREYPRDDSRPDFFFKINETEYIIEAKIYNKNHHFKKYKKAFPNAERSYITNYFMEKQDGYQVRTWEGFYNEIKDEEDEMIKAYTAYLKKICHITEIEKMNLSYLQSIRDLIIIFQKTIEANSELKLVTSKHGDHAVGKKFELSNNSTKGWFGTVYHMKTILVYIKDLSLPEILFEKENFSAYNFIDNKPWYQDGGIYFMMKNDIFDDNFTNENTSLEIQKDILDKFLKEVIQYILKKKNKI